MNQYVTCEFGRIIAKPRVPAPAKPFGAWTEDALALAWASLARAEGHTPIGPQNIITAKANGQAGGKFRVDRASKTLLAILKHLRIGDDTRVGTIEAATHVRCGNSNEQLQKAIDYGWIKATAFQRSTLLTLTSPGHEALALMRVAS